jgi:hypothetical protein
MTYFVSAAETQRRVLAASRLEAAGLVREETISIHAGVSYEEMRDDLLERLTSLLPQFALQVNVTWIGKATALLAFIHADKQLFKETYDLMLCAVRKETKKKVAGFRTSSGVNDLFRVMAPLLEVLPDAQTAAWMQAIVQLVPVPLKGKLTEPFGNKGTDVPAQWHSNPIVSVKLTCMLFVLFPPMQTYAMLSSTLRTRFNDEDAFATILIHAILDGQFGRVDWNDTWNAALALPMTTKFTRTLLCAIARAIHLGLAKSTFFPITAKHAFVKHRRLHYDIIARICHIPGWSCAMQAKNPVYMEDSLNVAYCDAHPASARNVSYACTETGSFIPVSCVEDESMRIITERRFPSSYRKQIAVAFHCLDRKRNFPLQVIAQIIAMSAPGIDASPRRGILIELACGEFGPQAMKLDYLESEFQHSTYKQMLMVKSNIEFVRLRRARREIALAEAQTANEKVSTTPARTAQQACIC